MEREKHISCLALIIARPPPRCPFRSQAAGEPPEPALPAHSLRSFSGTPLPERRSPIPGAWPTPGFCSRSYRYDFANDLTRRRPYAPQCGTRAAPGTTGTTAPLVTPPLPYLYVLGSPPRPPPSPKVPELPAGLACPSRGSGASAGSLLRQNETTVSGHRLRRVPGGEEPRTGWAAGGRRYPSPAPPGGDLSPRVPPLDAGKFRSGIARNTLCVGSASRGARR
ncbi:suppressor of cytokine signaling 2 isoform X1 [Camarhynchus parvulus]|uniref:suppressor of cytokine signaling 2 isoform X1 n=1 Tax=Geospiza parvula TaxID=87175 RepID=UPI0012383D33|nr:suppressor of cytokine signaling 2 isoform X1 [Camarhynchus parvulus]XP_030815428.1 suppressor of cytokine signaling 2 isoform X1 [Camarhynchus parvulus]